MTPGGFKPPSLDSLEPLKEYKPEDIQNAVAAAAERHGVSKDLLFRVAKQESSFKPDALSPKGAMGPMQLMPATAKDLGVDPKNVDQNIEGGARYLKQLLDRYGGDESKALAAYNAGMGRVDSGKPLPAETRNYVAQIGGGRGGAPSMQLAQTGGRGGAAPQEPGRFTPPPLSSLEPEQPEQPQEQPKTGLQTAMDAGRWATGQAGKLFSGIGGAGFSTAKGLATLAERGANLGMPGGPVERALEQSPTVQKLTEDRPGVMENVGRMGEQMAEMAIPGPTEAKLASKLNEILPWGLRLAARAGLSGATTGAMTAIQSGGDPEAGLQGGKVAAGTTLFLGMLAAPLAKWGRRIQNATIRPRAMDVKDGFKMETIDKLGLKGNLEQSFNQVEKKLTDLRTARNNLIKPGTANVDLGKAFDLALTEIEQKAKELHFGEMGDTAINEVKKIREGVQNMLHPPQAPSGLLTAKGKAMPAAQPALNAVDISKVENLKEFMGMTGSWAFGRGEPDAKVKELVANTLYSKLRGAIEQSLGPQGAQVKALNKQMQELIPVKHAMMARLPVEQRNQVFSLTDIAAMIPAIVTGDVRMLALEGLTRGQKNIRFGNLMRRGVPQGAGRYAGEAVRQASPWVVPPMP